MTKWLSMLSLPDEVTHFERTYLARMHRIAWAFFCLHVPIFVALAWANGTGPLRALALTLLVLSGPAIARRGAVSPRGLSMVYAFTAMCMGALLTHFGQGPLQIEMHFYFFVLIALLAVFAHPATILVAAATVALHHLAFWALLPRSVFNYDAPVWAVGVHALFVVLESVAACFVARAFFDNVIGLEKIVETRTRALDARNAEFRLILDHADQGFLLLDAEGRVGSERSSRADEWLRSPAGGTPFADVLGAIDPRAASWFSLGWSQLQDDFLPEELVLAQLPQRLDVASRALALGYRVVRGDGGRIERVMVVVTDRSAEVARERAELEQQELLSLFGHFQRDRTGVRTFFSEGDAIVSRLTAAELPRVNALREIHTLKGNASLFGARSVSRVCHALESDLQVDARAPAPDEVVALAAQWTAFRSRTSQLVGTPSSRTLEVDEHDLVALTVAVVAGAPHAQIARSLMDWRNEPIARRLEALGQQTVALAKRLERCPVRVTVNADGVRVSEQRWAPFWAALAHVARNAADHGFETPEARNEAKKPPEGELALRAGTRGDSVILSIGDDGRGIDWNEVTRRATDRGLPAGTHEERVRALFTDGFTTRDEASETSGRGAGMSAILEATLALGGTIDVRSRRGEGTVVSFEIPRDEVVVRHDSILRASA